MGRYLAMWSLGGAMGLLATGLVLRHRRVPIGATLGLLAITCAGTFVGARWHFRLETLPVREALLVSPRELLDAGFRLPLGLVVGAALAGLFCWWSRTSWRDAGDALAVGASVMIPIGRIGCLLYGCCTGVVCGPWARPFCLRMPPGSEVFLKQQAAGLIAWESPFSLPVHPLAIYFALASLATLAVLLWLMRRGAPPGYAFGTFCILRPLAKLGIETLRGGTLGGLMVAIPLATATASATGLVIAETRRLARVRQPSVTQ